MAEDKGKKTLELKGKLTLGKDLASLKSNDAKARGKVTVQVKRKRVVAPATAKEDVQPAPSAAPEPAEQDSKAATEPKKEKNFTSAEWEARMRVLRQAERVEEELAARRAKDEDSRKKLLQDRQDHAQKIQQEQEESLAQKQAEEAEAERALKDKEKKRKYKEKSEDAQEQDIAAVESAVLKNAVGKKPLKGHADQDGEEEASKDDKKHVKRGDAQRRQSKKIDVQRVMAEEEEVEENQVTSILTSRRGEPYQPSLIKKTPPKKKGRAKTPSAHIEREVVVPESITVGELANRMAVRSGEVVKKLMQMGTMATVNQAIDRETAELLVEDFGHKIKRHADVTIETVLDEVEDRPEDLQPRPPVVTVMGHVDHGKTSLLDALRKTDVVAGEAGGITQHIGAYQVTVSSGQKITFIDTPGHAAFSEMRSRGANVTDIVILVVAADDGIKEQTIEAINHAKAAGVPIIVAINKVDKPEANPDRVRQELLSHELVVESMGGDVLEVEVSAKKGTNLHKLEEAVLLQAELLDLKANPGRTAQGVIIESRVEKGRGPVATVLIQQGTLQQGQIFSAGLTFGRARSLSDDHGKHVTSAIPAQPVEVTGFDAAPIAGDIFAIVASEAQAREIAEARQAKLKSTGDTGKAATSLEDLFARALQGKLKELPIIIKADVHGSLEAIKSSLEKLSTPEVAVRILHGAVGGVTLSDVTLAKTTGAFILAFNVRADASTRDVAEKEGADIRHYSIIYDAINDTKALMSGLLAPIERENFLGYAEIRQVFEVSKVGKIAGCMITQGVVKRGCKVRLLRDNVVVYEGDLKSLKRFKDEVKEAREGYECGIALENYNDIKVADRIECFEVEQIARTLDD